MGNTNSGKHERTYSSDAEGGPSSPFKEDKAFDFGVKKSKILVQTSLEESEEDAMRPGSDTLSDMPGLNEKCLPTVFKWDKGGKDVNILGTFSDWKPIQMVKSKTDFIAIIEVPEGDHEYKFQVDGQWALDTNEPIVDSGLGTKNNVISVKKSDFEVFEALAVDSVRTGNSNKISTPTPGSPPGSYSQVAPQRLAGDKPTSPPCLPPQLLQVILNQDVSMSCEPTLLPEPNHVMLNHLYALSIKDGVMVLSATHRFEKKYVTTLLYKPI